jgi:toxin ParE1/3/4
VASKVVFRRRAEERLIELYAFIAIQAGPAIAIGYIRRIREACQALAYFPERGHRRDDILPGLRVVGFERGYRSYSGCCARESRSSPSPTAAAISSVNCAGASSARHRHDAACAEWDCAGVMSIDIPQL